MAPSIDKAVVEGMVEGNDVSSIMDLLYTFLKNVAVVGSFESCTRAASGATEYCKMHGGGRRCVAEDCSKPAHNKSFCYKHFRLAGFNPRVNETCTISKCQRRSFRAFKTCKQHSRTEPMVSAN